MSLLFFFRKKEMIFLTFCGGLLIGSFLNVLIYRLPRGLSFTKGRSFCPKCKKQINFSDNIPLMSFVLLKGRCRFCHSSISWRYPVVELTTGVLFVLAAQNKLGRLGELRLLGVGDFLLTILLFSGLIVIFFIDLEHQIIPDEIIFPLIVLFSLRQFFPFPTSLSSFSLLTSHFSLFIAALFSSLFLFFIYLITKGKGMGFGDVKLAFLMGLVLGFPKIIIAFYLAFLTGAFVGIILILVKKAKFGQKIAFGPFLVLAIIINYLWGENIVRLITKFIF